MTNASPVATFGPMSPISLRIKNLREAKLWSQNELSRQSGVPQATISRIESGKQDSISFDVLEKLADALGVEPGDLLVRARPARKRS